MNKKDDLGDLLRGPISEAVRAKLDELEKKAVASYVLDHRNPPGKELLDADILQRSVWVVLRSMLECIRTEDLTPEAAVAAGLDPKADGGVLDINVSKLLKTQTAAKALLSLHDEYLACKAQP